MQEAVDVAVQLKYDRIQEESTTANQQFLDSIDDGMKKIIKEQVKKEVSKIIPKVEKLVTDQLESEVLVRSSKEANTSHAVAANLSELELKKILIDKMEANNSINRSDIQRQLYKALVEAYEADKILLDTYGDTVTIKRPRDAEKTTSTGLKTHKKSASQSAPVGEAMQSTDVLERPADQEFETGVQDEQAEEEVQHLPDWFQQPTRLPSPDHAWNKSVPAVHETVQPWMSTKATTEKLDWINPEGRQYLHDLRQPLPIQLEMSIQIDEIFACTLGNVTKLSVKNVLHLMSPYDVYTKSVSSSRRVDDLQLVLKLSEETQTHKKPDRTDPIWRRQDAYTPYSDPRGFIYENKDKKNRLMRIDELHKFSDVVTLDDVQDLL
ncbi:hypothetical protein Tco_0919335 [Tanacetum coccineum]